MVAGMQTIMSAPTTAIAMKTMAGIERVLVRRESQMAAYIATHSQAPVDI